MMGIINVAVKVNMLLDVTKGDTVDYEQQGAESATLRNTISSCRQQQLVGFDTMGFKVQDRGSTLMILLFSLSREIKFVFSFCV